MWRRRSNSSGPSPELTDRVPQLRSSQEAHTRVKVARRRHAHQVAYPARLLDVVASTLALAG